MSFISYFDLCARYPRHLDAVLRNRTERWYPLLQPMANAYRRLAIPHKRLVTVVGSLGKTTTTRALRAVLLDRDHFQTFSNYGSSLAANLLRSRRDDPYDVLEVGISGPGQMKSYARMICPDIVVVTSIASDHNRSFDSLEETREEKAEMVRVLSPRGTAILNGDDPNVAWMASQTAAKVLWFGTDSSHDVWASDIRSNWPSGIALTLHVGGESHELQSRLLGHHMVYPLLAASAAAWVEGRPLSQVVARLETVEPAISRLERHTLPNGSIVIDDSFKSGLDSYRAAADVMSSISTKRRIGVLAEVEEPVGSLGPIYRELGERFGGCLELMIFHGSKRVFRPLRSAAVQAGMRTENVIHAAGELDPVTKILENAQLGDGDVTLLKGPSAKRLRRILLRLQGKTVRCSVSGCRIKVASCETCPFLAEDTTRLRNPLVTRLITHRQNAES